MHQPIDLEALCAERGIKPHETGYFSPTNKVDGVNAGLQFNQMAFALSPNVPFSDPASRTT